MYGGRSYEDFRQQIPHGVRDHFDALREYCLSLEGRVTEDVRMHRVVWGKSISFRWFADAEPTVDSILLKIQRDRREPVVVVEIRSRQQLEDAKEFVRTAFLSIR